MINLMILIMLWTVTIGLAALCGYISAVQGLKRKGGEKSIPEHREPTQAEKKEMERAQREYENFMTYTGKPQDSIDTE